MDAQTKREILVSQAVHSAALEGFVVSPAFQKDCADYIAGMITADRLVELTLQRCGLVTGC